MTVGIKCCGHSTRLRADDRAVIGNMAPEYGASTGFFPIDVETVDYLRRTARSASLIASIDACLPCHGFMVRC